MARGRKPRPLGCQTGRSRGNRLGLSQRALFCPMATREYRPRPGNDAQWQCRLARSRRCWAEADRQIEYNVFAASLRRRAKVGPKTGVRCGKRHTEASKGQEGKRTRLVDGPVRGSRRCVVDDSTSLGQGKRLSCLGWWKGPDRSSEDFSIGVGVVRPVAVGHRVRKGSGRTFLLSIVPPLAPAVDSSFVARPFED